eukprot:GFKZ01006596.1.p1 GENE.GFKZ01006596.1~~GFKZ01006596.1.p1  ORF type:complete len:600 (+),score=56.97 GFKZ01006596.1:255-2054(+)
MLSATCFHPGELAVQRRAGTRGVADELSAGISDVLPANGRINPLFNGLRFINVASISGDLQTKNHFIWVSAFFGKNFIHYPSPEHLHIGLDGIPKHDVFFENMSNSPQNPVGLLALDLPARRRWRTNGTINFLPPQYSSPHVEVNIRESFPNCPKYIQIREVTSSTTDLPPLSPNPAVQKDNRLSDHDKTLIHASDTFFIGTYYKDAGVDCNHRGGLPGFVRVLSDNELYWPDYRGNGLFQSFGNLHMNDRAGLAFIDFDSGHVLQLSGSARVEWDIDPSLKVESAATRVVRFKVEAVRRSLGPATSYRWGKVAFSPYNPIVGTEQEASAGEGGEFPVKVTLVKIVQESPVVKTFRFLAPRRVQFLPGQYATFDFGSMPHLGTGDEPIVRTWTLSEVSNSIKGDLTLEVSVKRKRGGLMSNWLHDHATPGVTARLLGIDGDMTPFRRETLAERFLLVSGGIGITPNMAILRGLGARLDPSVSYMPDVIFLHQERFKEDIPFRNEIRRRASRSNGTTKLITFISGNSTEEGSDLGNRDEEDFDKFISGRIGRDDIRKYVPDVESREAYLCGPISFMKDMSRYLISLGVPVDRIVTEEFNF